MAETQVLGGNFCNVCRTNHYAGQPCFLNTLGGVKIILGDPLVVVDNEICYGPVMGLNESTEVEQLHQLIATLQEQLAKLQRENEEAKGQGEQNLVEMMDSAKAQGRREALEGLRKHAESLQQKERPWAYESTAAEVNDVIARIAAEIDRRLAEVDH